MKGSRAITEADLQDYIEGRLESSKRKVVEERLAQDSELAGEAEQMRRQVVRLQSLAKTILDEPIPPEMLALISKYRPE